MGYQPKSPPILSLAEKREYAMQKYRSALRISRMAVVFAVVWPLTATVLYIAGPFSLFNVVVAYLAPIMMFSLMWYFRSIPRDGMWRMWHGTMVFQDTRHDPAEVQEWVDSCYGVDRVHRFVESAWVFRHKKDATLFKLMWG